MLTLPLIAWPAALAIGLSLGLLGSGGSILTIPVLIYLCGLSEKMAIASALIIVACISFVGAMPYIRAQKVQWKVVFGFGMPGMFGTYLGAYASHWISGTIQLVLFAIVMISAAFFMIRRPAPHSTAPLQWYRLLGGGFLVGIVTGLVGVGGGFLIVPALLLLARIEMTQAVASSLVIICSNALIGFFKYFQLLHNQGLHFNWPLIVLVSVLGIVGSWIGSKWAIKLPQTLLRRIFAIMLVLMGGYILYHSANAYAH
ncbi:sulfite exporter TauE/SafE family protein [Celerinatantimonas yamalensis]|uniref:Probable membrane transporter protein n=1 Tax=Celerinatantimonas yamalensis TaxID=559956 RepID=A0ABW9G8D6_9GAMM